MYFCLWGVASPVVSIGGETHLILEPHYREQTEEATTSVPRPVLHQHRPIHRQWCWITIDMWLLPVNIFYN